MKQDFDSNISKDLRHSKIRFSRKIAAVVCLLLALIFSYVIYSSEYKFDNDKDILSAAITEYASHGRYALEDANVLETKEIDGILIAFFKDNNNPDVFGFARLLKGLNMKYRLVNASYGPDSYSAVVKTYKFDTNKGTYYAVGGYNCDENIVSYGIRLFDDKDFDTKDILKYNIKNSQFLDILKNSDLQKNMKEIKGKDEEYFFSHRTVLLDSKGNDITENYFIPTSNSGWGAGVGTAELFTLNVLVAIVMILGVIFTRYFWREE